MSGLTIKAIDGASLRVVSFGAGVQSTALLLMAAHREIGPMPDHVIFADTGFEPKGVYDHLVWARAELQKLTNGSVGFHVVSAGNIRDDHLNGLNTTGQRFASMPLYTKGGGGIGRRQCTKEYKIEPIRAKIRELLGVEKGKRVPAGIMIENWIGISVDEIQRAKPARDKWQSNRYPLIEAGLNRGDCVAWFSRHYPDRPLSRSACVACPFRDNDSWRQMKAGDPDSWQQAVAFDRQLRKGNLHDGRNWSARYVHRSGVALEDADLGDERTIDMFAYECEGMCGV